ncbi:MAG: hypothetical protein HOM14_01900 [Gammaproteobacteria bacterium]|jgi:saccharopine dehydrogenase-like NADP-dependent oxidoreductase|nr:hypothetical protein [Gammaproteobacteria bacterium]MBT3725004.1 hypothetical protein [Gammaproteobacteria bacterium]MBT4075067.1 hypothetical protein [Gammaproteobacteria bacterium]MBT4193873.1 hypothetical protein [Gammaproteobacteria bacterium]MBT4449715.1 hypothetical protein [Gammaproteobacteria bacterium]
MNNNDNSAPKQKVVIVGAGRTGLAIADQLSASQRYEVILVDPVDEAKWNARERGFNVEDIDGTDSGAMKKLLNNVQLVVVSAPDFVAEYVVKVVLDCGCHYIDVSENTILLDKFKNEMLNATQSFVPQCGLAPGYMTSYVSSQLKDITFDAEVQIYVGVLPKQKTNRLGYGNIWGIGGLMTEYTSQCKAITMGEEALIEPLTEYETLRIDGVNYEAFTTSGSIDELVDLHKGKLKKLVFKTLRYEGHLDYIQFLLDDLKLDERHKQFESLLLNGLPLMDRDQVIVGIVVNSSGNVSKGQCLSEKSQFNFFPSTENKEGKSTSAISMISAAHVCCVIDMVCSSRAPHTGLLLHNEIELDMLEQSHFYASLNVENL